MYLQPGDPTRNYVDLIAIVPRVTKLQESPSES